MRAMTGGAGHAQRHVEHSDYYDEQRRVQGEWHGHGAELLGQGGLLDEHSDRPGKRGRKASAG